MNAELMIILGPLLLGFIIVMVFVVIPTCSGDNDDNYHNYIGDE